ncbi:hypothetical protein [Sinomonas halotolerans]|uniref:Uncharacterized protein n=1 Tax=Sinomonas halotolerans TaxID=1644133 RepID=A0ABU9WYY0_9MICC
MSEERSEGFQPEHFQPEEVQPDQERLDGFQHDTGIASDKGDEKARDLEERAYGDEDDAPDVPLPG